MVAVTVAFWFDRNDWDHYSIFYVAFISIYANFATNYGALAASQSSEAAHEAAEHATVLRNESPYVSSVEE